jgi:hypothetical protein
LIVEYKGREAGESRKESVKELAVGSLIKVEGVRMREPKMQSEGVPVQTK